MDLLSLWEEKPSLQKPDWFKSIFTRIDPNYGGLEEWVKGKGKTPQDDFERGIALLFSLCGLNTMHVGGCYESATLKGRRNSAFQNPNAPIDVLAWSSDNNSLYLCQCSLGGIKDKIEEIATFSNELDKIILMDYTSRPKIHPLIITNVEGKGLHDNIEEAKNKHVKIITGDVLLLLINSVRMNNIITKEDIQHLLTLENTIISLPDTNI